MQDTHTYTEILFSHEKEWNPSTCDNMVGPSGPYTKESKSGKEIQILYVITYICNLEKLNWQKQRVGQWWSMAGGVRNGTMLVKALIIEHKRKNKEIFTYLYHPRQSEEQKNKDIEYQIA